MLQLDKPNSKGQKEMKTRFSEMKTLPEKLSMKSKEQNEKQMETGKSLIRKEMVVVVS